MDKHRFTLEVVLEPGRARAYVESVVGNALRKAAAALVEDLDMAGRVAGQEVEEARWSTGAVSHNGCSCPTEVGRCSSLCRWEDTEVPCLSAADALGWIRAAVAQEQGQAGAAENLVWLRGLLRQVACRAKEDENWSGLQQVELLGRACVEEIERARSEAQA